MSVATDLLGIAGDLEACMSRLNEPEIAGPANRLEVVTNELANAWCGSFFGYHANIYYKDFKPPPAGDHFDIESGNKDIYGHRFRADTWVEYTPTQILGEIWRRVGISSPDLLEKAEKTARTSYELLQGKALSLLVRARKSAGEDQFLSDWIKKAEVTIPSRKQIANSIGPRRKMQTRDTIAAQGGIVVPIHLEVQSYAVVLNTLRDGCASLVQTLQVISSHLAEQVLHLPPQQTDMDAGTKIFIGHGQSIIWRELKDFIADRLHLEWDEFNRLPVAGETTVDRLKQMLNEASFAFLIFTAEDQVGGETARARQNVVHEAGLFQGRLGFKRAIILLEEGCEEFSNITGLGQIRFPKGHISAKFEDIRLVLEREQIISPRVNQVAAASSLSSSALQLLNEIDSEEKGDGKGITLFDSDLGVGHGHYFPFLWSPLIQGGESSVMIISLGPIKRAVAELVKAGLLALDAEDGDISRYYRTDTGRP